MLHVFSPNFLDEAPRMLGLAYKAHLNSNNIGKGFMAISRGSTEISCRNKN